MQARKTKYNNEIYTTHDIYWRWWMKANLYICMWVQWACAFGVQAIKLATEHLFVKFQYFDFSSQVRKSKMWRWTRKKNLHDYRLNLIKKERDPSKTNNSNKNHIPVSAMSTMLRSLLAAVILIYFYIQLFVSFQLQLEQFSLFSFSRFNFSNEKQKIYLMLQHLCKFCICFKWIAITIDIVFAHEKKNWKKNRKKCSTERRTRPNNLYERFFFCIWIQHNTLPSTRIAICDIGWQWQCHIIQPINNQWTEKCTKFEICNK